MRRSPPSPRHRVLALPRLPRRRDDPHPSVAAALGYVMKNGFTCAPRTVTLTVSRICASQLPRTGPCGHSSSPLARHCYLFPTGGRLPRRRILHPNGPSSGLTPTAAALLLHSSALMPAV